MIKLKDLLEDKIVVSKGEMAKLHNDGQIEKDGHVIVYDESVNEAKGNVVVIDRKYIPKIAHVRKVLKLKMGKDLSVYKTDSNNVYHKVSDSQIKRFLDRLDRFDVKYKLGESVNEKMDKRQGGETLKQLGGNRFIAMTGAKNFAVGPKGMSFKIGRNSKNVNYVRIDLKGDLYNMEFIQMRGGKMKVKSKEKGVYNDQLQKMFTKYTGMYTSL